MEIRINGETQEVAEHLTAAELVAMMGLGGRRIAIEVNEEIVPRSSFSAHRLLPGDKVEIVQAIGGG